MGMNQCVTPGAEFQSKAQTQEHHEGLLGCKERIGPTCQVGSGLAAGIGESCSHPPQPPPTSGPCHYVVSTEEAAFGPGESTCSKTSR